jgi:peptidyl-prolyl cis-trans isomerase C
MCPDYAWRRVNQGSHANHPTPEVDRLMTFAVSARITVAALVFAFGFSNLASAEDAAANKPTPKVVAIVNGEQITEMDLAAALTDLRDTLTQFPPDQQMPALIKGVIDIRLMARAAEAQSLDKNEENAHLLAYVRDRTLRNAYLTEKLTVAVTDATIKARYDAETAKFVPADELHAAHILVATEDEAKAIIADLDKGGDFAAIAKEKSVDKGSGAQGGDLGFFGHGMMVKEFETAAYALPVGTYTKTPVQTQFGWHIIKVIETRKQTAPTFESRQEAIRRDLAREFILADIEKLHAAAKIEIIPPEPAPATPPAPGDAAPAPAPAPAQ